MLKLVTAVPLGVYPISGSLGSRPMSSALFKLDIYVSSSRTAVATPTTGRASRRRRLWLCRDRLQSNLRRRRCHGGHWSGLFRLAHDEMAQDLFCDLQAGLQLRHLVRVELEVLEHVGAFLLVLDLVGELALAPEVGRLDRAPGALDQPVDALHRVLDLLVVQVSADDVQNLVIPQREPPSYGFEAPVERQRDAAGRGQKGLSVFY